MNSRLFVHSIGTIQSHILKFEPFLTSFAISHAFNDLFWAKWPWKWKASTNKLRKGWNLAWYHHFTHITCLQKLRGLRQKLDALRVQTGPSLLKCDGFRRKLISYKRHFIFLNFFEIKTFCAFNMHHSKVHTKIWTLSDFICYFSCI